MNGEHFHSMEEFYAADERRYRSPEWDFGVHWIDDVSNFPTYRVSWVVETGELYCFRQGFNRRGRVSDAASTVWILGTVPKVGEYPYGGGGDRWSQFNKVQTIERVMKGWAEVAPPRLAWVIYRLREEAQR